MDKRWWIAGSAAAVVAAAAAVFTLWPDDSMSDAECQERFGAAISSGEFPEECSEWFEASLAELGQGLEVVSACQERIAEKHARTWTPELEFTNDATAAAEDGRIQVTGEARSTNRLGETWGWDYECLVAVDDGEIRVLQADIDRA